MSERGGSARPGGPAGKPRPTRRSRVDSWDRADYDYYSWPRVVGHKYLVRRRRTKLRVKAMTPGRRFLRRLMLAGTWFLGLVAALMVAVIVLYYQFTDVPRPEDLAAANQQVATIQYSDGSTLARIGTLDRTIVPLDRVPASARWAALAAEERNFYDNGAVSITGTLRAAAVDVTGGERQGGSGITQQYVKNAYLNDDPSLTRKLKELMIAVKLSRDHSKDEILSYYLNTVYYGRGAYGIEAAAKAYFNTDVSKLTVAQGALLAAVLRAPSYYDPALNPTQSKARWDYVVQGMVATGHLSAQQAATLTFPATRKPTSDGLGVTGWKFLVVKAVLAELAQQGITADQLYQRGMIVRTTIDPRAQKAALNAINTTFDDLTPKQRNLKNSLVAVNPKSGGILAYYPGSGPGVKGYNGQQDYNDWAQQRANAPGSSFKPFVLATVLQQTIAQKNRTEDLHYAINSKVDGSACKKIEGTKICNDPGESSHSGPSVTITNAMRYSLNSTFDDLASQAGPDNVAAMAHKLGVASTDSDGRKTLVNLTGADKGHTSFGIGIGDYPVTTLDMANGYATLANEGVRNPSYLVEQATSFDGDVVYRHAAHDDQVLDARIANDVSLTLRDVAGDANRGLDGGRQSAAKTGTEGVSGGSKNNSDAWMVGFTPQVSAAVWVGTGARAPIFNSAGQPMYGKDMPAQVWQKFMDGYLKASKAKKLDLPDRQLIDSDGKTIPKQPTYTPSYEPSYEPSEQNNTPSDEPSSRSRPTRRDTPTPPADTPTPPPTQPTAPAPPADTCGILGSGTCPTP